METLSFSSKAIAEKVDWGGIFLPITEEDKVGLRPIIAKGFPEPNMKLSVYKNRRGSFTRGYVWLLADKGTCRYEQVFVTDWNYNYNKDVTENPLTIVTLPKAGGGAA